MSRKLAYLSHLSLNQLCDEYEIAEKYGDIYLMVRIMEECENRKYED